MKFEKEEDLAKVLIEYMTDLGWDVYPEVLCPTGRMDLYAKRGPAYFCIEAKLNFNLEVVEQAFLRLPYANWVAIGVPAKRRASELLKRICKDYGIGIFRVGYNNVDIVVPAKMRRKIRPQQIHEDQKANVAGSSKKYWTPFKATCNYIVREALKVPGGLVLKDVIKGMKHHYSNNGSAHSCLVDIIKRGDVIPELFLYKSMNRWMVCHKEAPPKIHRRTTSCT